MPIPEFVVELRKHVGTAELWLSGVTAVVLRERAGVREVLMVRRSDNGWWTPVTGIMDPGEDVHTSALREVAEETTVVAAVERLVYVRATGLAVYPNGDRARYLDHTVRCRWVSGEPAVGDDENTEARWFDVRALPEGTPEEHRERIAVALANPVDVRLG